MRVCKFKEVSVWGTNEHYTHVHNPFHDNSWSLLLFFLSCLLGSFSFAFLFIFLLHSVIYRLFSPCGKVHHHSVSVSLSLLSNLLAALLRDACDFASQQQRFLQRGGYKLPPLLISRILSDGPLFKLILFSQFHIKIFAILFSTQIFII